MKNKLTLTLICFSIFNCLLFATPNDKSTLKKIASHPTLIGNKASKKNCSVTLTGNLCVGSTLTVNSSDPVASIVWLLNGSPILEQSIGKQNNGKVVAGGNGTGPASNQLYNPNRLFVDRQGNMYIPDMSNNRVQKWSPGATVGITVAGGNGSGSAANQFNRPTSVAVDNDGNMYVCDQYNSRIQKWVPGATTGVTVASSLSLPTGVFIDRLGNLYVSEQNSQCIRKFNGATGTGVIVAGGNGYGSSANQLASPTGIFVDDQGNLYICDTDNARVQKWESGATSGTTVARVNGNPLGVYVDGSNNLYVTDYTGSNVQKWLPGASTGTIIAGGNGQGNDPNQITPAGVWMDTYNNLYVSDFLNGRVIKFENIYTGTYTTLEVGTYTAQITTTDGCVATSNPIIVKASVTPEISISSNTNLTCDKFPPIFTATFNNGGSNPKLQWRVNAIAVSNANSLTFIPTGLTENDVISCELRNQDDCVSTNPVYSNNVIVTTTAQETPTVSITSDVDETCKGTKITFTATTTNVGLSPIYQWKINGNSLPGNSPSFQSSTLKNNDEVTCTVLSDAKVCQTTSNATSNNIVVKINSIVTPSITIAPDLTEIYQGIPVTFTAKTLNGGTSPKYKWFVNGELTRFRGSEFISSTLLDGDEVSCELTSDMPCSTSNTASSNTIKVNIIKEIPINPPNAFSPNNDGINDLWTIKNLKYFPKCKVYIYNRNGTRVFYSMGYANPWAGYHDNIICNPGVYYYVIHLDDKKVISGSLTIFK